MVDHSKRGTCRCRKCKKVITKGEIRIGKSAVFKSKTILQYHHAQCIFKSFKNARLEKNIIKDISQIDGVENITDQEKQRLCCLIEDMTLNRASREKKSSKKRKEPLPMQESAASRTARLKSTNLPSMKIMCTNADQMTSSKMMELKELIQNKKPLIVAVCEVKPKTAKERTLKDYEIPNYSLHPVNLNNSTGRGIAVYTHSSIDKSIVQIKPNLNFEEVCLLEVRLRGGDCLLFGSFYRSPTTTSTSNQNNEQLNRLLEIISKKKYSHRCLVGDFNFKHINWKTWTTPTGEESTDSKFVETIRDCYLHQHVDRPTRRRGKDEPSLLDLVFSDETMHVSGISHLPPLGKSDHEVLAFDFHCYLDYSKGKGRFIYDKGSFDGMRAKLKSENWSEDITNSMKNKTVESIWQSIKSKVLDLRNEFVPHQAPSSGSTWKDKGSVPISAESRDAIRKKKKLHRLWMLARAGEGADMARTAFQKVRNKVKALLRKDKMKFERGIALQAKSNPKAFWLHTRKKLRTKCGVAPLLSDPKDSESMKFDDHEKANILQSQFTGVFTQEPDGDLPPFENRTNISMKHMYVSGDDVLSRLKLLKTSKKHGADEIHPRMLSELAEELAEPLALLFNTSMKEGVLPADWKTAMISAIYKKGSKHIPENYRPISLTSIVCKLMEGFVRDEVMQHLIENKLLSAKQFGFIPGRSTTTQLLYYLDKCVQTIADGGVVDAIYFDFSKAFDTVPHRRLVKKLKAYGINGDVLEWITEFLHGRTQEVIVNGEKSVKAPVISGIPQGTVLGPVLFVVYINDLLENIKSDGLMFADDTKIFRPIATLDDALTLQNDINVLEEWTKSWLLRFHPDKCHVLTFGKFENIRHTHRYKIGDKEIEHMSEEKDLGIILDEDLRFDEHIATKIRVANAIVGQIRRSFTHLDCDSFRRMFIAFVRPHLEYGQSVWSPHLLKHVKAIENVQIRATKLVNGLHDLDYEERLRRLDLPTLSYRRRRGDMIEMYKHFHFYDRETTSTSFNPQTRPSRKHKFQLYVRPSKDGARGVETNFFFQRTAETWNGLPAGVVNAEDINEFKNNLDDHWREDMTK